MTKILRKKILFNLIFIFLTFFFPAFGLEINYPSLPGVGTPQNCAPSECLPQYIAYWFGFAIYIGGAIALISLTIGAIQVIFSTGNPELVASGKERVVNSFVGLVLLFSSFIILRTINPTLVEPSLTPLTGVQGVYLMKNQNDTTPAPLEMADIRNNSTIQQGYTTLYYKCSNQDAAPALYLWKYPRPFMKGTRDYFEGVEVKRITCEGTESLSGVGSYRLAFETDGVYFFLGPNCTGYMSLANSSTSTLGDGIFNEKLRSIKILNGDVHNRYGVIVHEQPNYNHAGACTEIIINEAPLTSKCENINLQNPRSIHIFKIEKKPETAGAGVNLYSEPFGWAEGSKSLIYRIDYQKINYRFSSLTNEIQYLDRDNNPEYQKNLQLPNATDYLDTCPDFSQCHGSAKLNGRYLLNLSRHVGNTIYCQTFTESISNFNAVEFFKASSSQSAQNTQERIEIIAIK